MLIKINYFLSFPLFFSHYSSFQQVSGPSTWAVVTHAYFYMEHLLFVNVLLPEGCSSASAELVSVIYLLHLLRGVFGRVVRVQDAAMELIAWLVRRWRLAGSTGPSTREDVGHVECYLGSWEVQIYSVTPTLPLYHRCCRCFHRGLSWVDDITVVVGEVDLATAKSRLLRLG